MFEEKALEKYQQKNKDAQTVGLLVHPDLPWLGASPDGLVMSDVGQAHLIEIKSCKASLGRKSPAWHQVQGAMAIASGAFHQPVTLCKIIDAETTYNIVFEEEWWKKLLKLLKAFYFGTFLPMAAKQILQKVRERQVAS